MAKKQKNRKIRITGQKRECEACNHKHKRMGKGKPWFCMKPDCQCTGLVVGGTVCR
jgi:hypothetical protein